MATSPNYAWAEPDNSSLVKNGAADIRTLGDAIDTSVWNVGYGQAGKNKVINGDFAIWQRGTSGFSGTTVQYTADRWFASCTGTMTVARESTIIPTNSLYSIKLSSTAAANQMYLQQAIETSTVVNLAGRTLSISGQVAASASAGVTLYVAFSTATDNSPVGSWTTITATTGGTATPTSSTFVPISGTYAIPANAKSLTFGIFTAAVASGVSVYLGRYQVEVGSTVTPFQTASGGSPQAELAMCQRYFQRWSLTQFNRAGLVYADSTTNVVHVDKLPVVLRSTPTLTFTNMTANGNAVTAAAVGGYLDTNNTLYLNLTTSGVVAGLMYQLYVASGQTGVISYSSEL
jgi:hypothetical protein